MKGGILKESGNQQVVTVAMVLALAATQQHSAANGERFTGGNIVHAAALQHSKAGEQVWHHH